MRLALGSLPIAVLAAIAVACWIWPGSISPAAAVALEAATVFAASYMLGESGRDVNMEDL